MAGEEQERFEDYLELEHYIEQLQKESTAQLPQDLTPEQARIYRMATQFHSATPHADQPRPEFVSSLYGNLRQLQQQSQGESAESVASPVVNLPQQEQPEIETTEASPTESAPPAPEVPQPQAMPRRAHFVSRRSLLTGGAVAAASLAIGTGIGASLHITQPETSKPTQTPSPYETRWLIPEGSAAVPTTWHLVTTVAKLGSNAIQFTTGALTGYVILKDQSSGDVERDTIQVIAFLAACTHMGCTVQWHNSDRCFHCPCHGGMFTEYGTPDPESAVRYLTPLPRLRVKIEHDNVYVEVPNTK